MLLSPIFFKVAFLTVLLGLNSCITISPSSVQNGPTITVGEEIHHFSLLCPTREQAEQLILTRIEKGPEKAFELFRNNHCFPMTLNLVPVSVLLSRSVDGFAIRVVEVTTKTRTGSTVNLYMVTWNRVVSGVET